MKAKKQFGQNFLNSKAALEAIIACSNIHKNEMILEIGPGLGALTEYLLKTGASVVAIEKDTELVPILTEKFKSYSNFTLLQGDFLEINLETLLKDKDFKLVANIPYYITGQILRKFVDDGRAQSMTLLVQKEVAERICKRGENKDKESLVSLAVQSFGVAKYIKTVPRGAFTPAPNVDSAIIYIENTSKVKFPHESPRVAFADSAQPDISLENITLENRKLFFDLIHAGFAHKRKFLISNLKEKFDNMDFEAIFNAIGLDHKIRSEDLKFEDWLKIVSCVKENKANK